MDTIPIHQYFKKESLFLLQEHSKYGRSLENHCLRLVSFTDALAQKESFKLDMDLIEGACYLHDIGLLVLGNNRTNYLQRGNDFVLPYLEKWQLSPDAQKIVVDVMLYSHSIRKIPGISKEGAIVGKAVSVEHSLGLIRHGLDRKTIKGIMKKYPRLDFNRVLVDFFKISAFSDDITQIPRFFYPKT